MSTHNNMKTSLQCPRCRQSGEMEIELYFGFGNLIDYRIGDKVQ
jgi:hypothetical protein